MGMRDNSRRVIIKPANRKPVIRATIAAAILLAISGAGYRVLAWRLGATDGAQLLPPGALQRLPMKICDWVGHDVKLDIETEKQTDTNGHVNRRYQRNNGSEVVSLYIAYGVRVRAMMPHRPEVCMILQGWTLEGKRLVNLPLTDGTELRCYILDFSKSGLSAENKTILNYYIVDGKYYPDVSLLRDNIFGDTGYVAQMQISCSGNGSLSSKSSDEIVSAFVVDSTRDIYDLFPRSDDDLKSMWVLFDKVMAEYKAADPKGHAELMELDVIEHRAEFRAKVGKMMGERTEFLTQSTTLPEPGGKSND